MTLDNTVHAFRLHVLERAERLGNASAACRDAGISRTMFYRWRKRFLQYGADGLHPRVTKRRPGRPLKLGAIEERRIIALALAWPTWGPQRLSLQLAEEGCPISPTTVWRALRRVGLGTRVQRLLLLESHSVASAGLLTERTRRSLSRHRLRHVEAEESGELVCLDAFYIGKLKGVGKLWQITACDAASSYAMAKVVPVCSTGQAAAFLKQVVAVEMAEGGGRCSGSSPTVGGEFKGEFDRACHELNVRHTRTRPRHAWTNGFVERLQGTILHEHWRSAFRWRQYFRRRFQLEASLEGFLEFYNFRRPHQGYRTKGRTPAEIF